MSFDIVEMTPGTNGIIIANQAVWRPPVFRENWTTLRVCAGIHVSNTVIAELAGTPRFYLGACHDAPDGGPGQSGCAHFVGVRANRPAWSETSVDSSPEVRVVGTTTVEGDLQYGKILSGTPSFFSIGTSAQVKMQIGAIHVGTATRTRSFVIVQLRRVSSTEIEVSIAKPYNDNTADLTRACVAATDSTIKSALANPGDIASVVDEINATLTNNAWNFRTGASNVTIGGSDPPLDAWAMGWSRNESNPMWLVKAYAAAQA